MKKAEFQSGSAGEANARTGTGSERQCSGVTEGKQIGPLTQSVVAPPEQR
jgi:hypothetical protein